MTSYLQAIILDMDGVLLDSPEINFRTFNMALEKYGVQIPTNSIPKYLSLSLRDQLEMWKKDFPAIPQNLDWKEFSKESFGYQLEIMKNKIKPDEEITTFIKGAKEYNLKLAVATSSTKKRAQTILELLQVDQYLDAVVTAEDVSYHKPHPEIFLETAKHLKVDPMNCVVIEDAVNGIEAANRAGMVSVAKVTKYYSYDDFVHAADVFEHFKDLSLHNLDELFPL